MDHVKGDIRFENVSFHYEDHNEKVLSNVNLEVKPGDYAVSYTHLLFPKFLQLLHLTLVVLPLDL